MRCLLIYPSYILKFIEEKIVIAKGNKSDRKIMKESSMLTLVY